ncbi:two-component system sensor histidine kinase DesK [Rubrivivax gelatinosus]|uniref:sensor histidine kinase n=1 Tax=Rubrivivax gelatinosus TaxID=28068 RepID=UPI0018CB6DE9|nr:histidine kinase [Rubrivivax gelatinosus]MBG6081808.1 two-component system sensor histidine kinase DesK [Rubrivivax gelatinosus]
MKTRAMPDTSAPELQQIDRGTRRMGYWFLAYLLLYPLPWLGHAPGTAALLASAAGVAVFLPLYLAGFGRSDRRALGCGAGVAAVGLALEPFGGVWGVFIVYACGLLGGVLPRRRAAAALAALAAVLAALVLWRGIGPWHWLPSVFFGAMTAVVSMYSAAFAVQSAELAASRDEARRLAVVAERERIARDLHDLLGHTLTAIAVKADLAGRVAEAEPARARAEIEDIRRIARAALADVRAALTDLRATTLATELAAARSALGSAGVELDAELPALPLPAAVETALAFVLREGVTNVVRHAQASRCRVQLACADGEVTLAVQDTAHAPAAARPAPPAEGHGLAGLRQRLRAVGGELSLIRAPQGSTLLARVPLAGEGGA